MYDSPSERRRRTIAGVSLGLIITIASVFVVGVLAVGVWKGGWFIASQANKASISIQQQNARQQAPLISQSAANQNQAQQDNPGSQQAFVDEIASDISTSTTDVIDEHGAAVPGQLQVEAINAAGQACLLQGQLIPSTTLPAGMGPWLKRNCYAGSLSPTSPIRSGNTG